MLDRKSICNFLYQSSTKHRLMYHAIKLSEIFPVIVLYCVDRVFVVFMYRKFSQTPRLRDCVVFLVTVEKQETQDLQTK